MPERINNQTLRRMMREAFSQELKSQMLTTAKPLVDENTKLRQENNRLSGENEQLKEELETASELIFILQGQVKINRGRHSLLRYLGVGSEITVKRKDEIEAAVKRVAVLIHPDKHQGESELVRQILGYLTVPITDSIDRLKRIKPKQK